MICSTMASRIVLQLLACVVTAAALLTFEEPAGAAQHGATGQPGTGPTAVGVNRSHQRAIDGRVVSVRRLSREVTVRTSSGLVYRVGIAPNAAIHASGAAGLNALRGGTVIHLDAVTGRNGKFVAGSVSVR